MEQLKEAPRPGDVVIGLSVGGNSPNILRVIKYPNRASDFTGDTTGRLGAIACHPLILTHTMANPLTAEASWE